MAYAVLYEQNNAGIRTLTRHEHGGSPVEFEDGEEVAIQYPDGHEERVAIALQTGRELVEADGHAHWVDFTRAGFYYFIHGLALWVPLHEVYVDLPAPLHPRQRHLPPKKAAAKKPGRRKKVVPHAES